MSTLSLIPEEKIKMLPNSSKSTESLYSSSSSKYSASGLFRRKAAARQSGFIPATNEVRQRVLSARRLRVKTLQNQLADAQQHIAELAHENRILRTLHKRQDSALSKYESTNAELPQLLHSHAEEIRVWQTKYRNLMGQNKELANKLKQKDGVILGLSDQNKHLNQLNKDKNLEDRERLSERVRYLENRIIEKDNDLKLMARRLQLESKSFKTQLHSEHTRYKELLSKLEKAKHDLATFGHLDPDIFDKLPKASLIPRSLSGNKIKIKSESPHSILLPPTDGAHLPSHVSTVRKSNRECPHKDGHSPKSKRDSERSSAPTSRRSSLLNKLPERRNSQKDEIAEAIKKGMSALASDIDGAQSSDEEENHVHFEDELKKEKPKQLAIKDFSVSDESADDYEDEFDEDTNDVIISSDNKKQDDFESIRKQMSDDYKERESFLDSFCNQSTEEQLPKRELRIKSPDSESLPKRANIDPKKKVKLLAALKAIDENKNEDNK